MEAEPDNKRSPANRMTPQRFESCLLLSGIPEVLWGATRGGAGYSNNESHWSTADAQQYLAARFLNGSKYSFGNDAAASGVWNFWRN